MAAPRAGEPLSNRGFASGATSIFTRGNCLRDTERDWPCEFDLSTCSRSTVGFRFVQKYCFAFGTRFHWIIKCFLDVEVHFGKL